MQNSYAVIANEYYNSDLHPTCADFASGSIDLLNRHPELVPRRGKIIEVGAGCSGFLASIPAQTTAATIIISDISDEMLNHSRLAFSGRADFVVCAAQDLPISDSSADLLVSLLGDPYNTTHVWDEAYRVLKDGGGMFYTTPSWEWATAFRKSSPSEKSDSAFFLTESGRRLYLASEILPPMEQSILIKNSGLNVEFIDSFTLADLKRKNIFISPKIKDYLDDDMPVVSGYFARKN